VAKHLSVVQDHDELEALSWGESQVWRRFDGNWTTRMHHSDLDGYDGWSEGRQALV